jgi:hypothetical protein
MPTTTWLAATTGQPPLAQQVNQLLVTHPFQNIYTGTQTASATGGSGNSNTNGLWLAQSFTTAGGQTAIGYGLIQVFPSPSTSSSTKLGPTTVSIYTNSAGAPGVPLVTATLTTEYSNVTPLDTIVPLPVTGLTAATTYWIVISAAGNSSFSYTWNKSSAVTGASTSPNGSAWTAQAYGFRYQIFDQSLIQPLAATWEDSGARWTAYYYNSNGTITQFGEYTSGQTTLGYTQSIRSLSYSSNLISGVS